MTRGLLPPRFRPIRVLGQGAAAEVVLAHDLELEREVAVKLLAPRAPADPTIPARFSREAVIAARLGSHPHVVTVYDTGRWHGRPFLLMEYEVGGSVEAVLAEGPVVRERALRWLREIAEALDAAHALGVVHRDLKPANLLLDDRDRVQIADFGIASAVDGSELTLTGTILGTAGYLAPEQARGERATGASDRYALAVVACELLTGRRPPVDDLPPRLQAVFDAALAERPEQRPSSAAALVSQIEAALAPPEPATVVESPRAYQPVTAILRHHRATARARRFGTRLAATVAAGLVAAFAVLALGYIRADAPAAVVTCTVSPDDHDANLVITGVAADAYCSERARTLSWSVREGHKLRSPDLGQHPTLVCRTQRDGLRIEVYDDGQQQIGQDLCGGYAANQFAAGA